MVFSGQRLPNFVLFHPRPLLVQKRGIGHDLDVHSVFDFVREILLSLKISIKHFKIWVQLVERLLLTPEICSSTPVIGYFYRALLNVNCVENKEKEAGNGPLKTF